MANTVADVLYRLVAEYYASVTAGGVECRLVVPAVTEQVAISLQERLVAVGLPSYLVIPKGTHSPSMQSRWIYAEGLTSVRQGAMIIVTCPGELANIQDSVVGTGGAIRSFAFSDEWPWLDDGIDYFRFDDAFTQKLVDQWAKTEADRKWLSGTLAAMVRATAASIVRAELLFDELLSTFSDGLYPALSTLREKFLFHCGIPRPDKLADAAIEQWEKLIEDIERLGRFVLEAHAQVGKRADVLERVDEIETDSEVRKRLKDWVNLFFDGLSRQGDRRLSGVLSLKGCWGSEPDCWNELGITKLEKLFDILKGGEDLALSVEAVPNPGLKADETSECVLLENGNLGLEIVFSGIRPGQQGDFKLAVQQRHRQLDIYQCESEAATWNCSISYANLFEDADSKKRVLRVQLLRKDVPYLEKRVTIHPCGTNVPFLGVIEPGFRVLTPDDRVEDDEVEKIQVLDPVHIHLLRHDPAVEPELTCEGQAISLKPRKEQRILDVEEVLDPSESPTGQLRLYAELDGQRIEVDLEAGDVERGEYTLERELIVQLARGRREKVAKLIEVFGGKRKEGYSSLGGLSDQTRQRARFTRAFEDDSSQGEPVLANLTGAPCANELLKETYYWRDERVLPGSISSLKMSSGVEALISAYGASRRNVIAAVASEFTHDPRWPKYAFLPTYVESKRLAVEQAMSDFLESYRAIVEYLRDKRSSLDWSECFLLTYLDCVVHWADDACKARVFLVGPWHPLVVAKRFLVQAALFASARRFKGTKDGLNYQFNRLAVLLDQVNAFKWQMMLNAVDRELEHAYVSATSDPGWLLAMSPSTFTGDQLGQVVGSIRRTLGLEAGLVPAAREQMATGYMRDFCYAYPSRRALSVRADEAYAPKRIVESALSLLYNNDEELTKLGQQLPGGVHLFLPDTEELESIQWRSPPICIYDLKKKSPPEAFRDVHLLPPAKPLGQAAGGESVPLPRGDGDHAVFCIPVRRVTTGASGTPVTSAHELDVTPREGSGIGDKFVSTLALIAALPTVTQRINWAYELPLTLEYMWNVLPGSQADPAAFIEYIRKGDSMKQLRALWDYSMSLTGALNSYFVLSLIPQGISKALNGSPVFFQKDVAHALVRELGEIGIAIGSESMRSGSKALGVIGVIGATRMFLAKPPQMAALSTDQDRRGFLIPVDSFKDLLGDYLEEPGTQKNQRADLLAVQIVVEPSKKVLKISFCAVECKYSSGTLTNDAAEAAFTQAQRTYERLLALAEVAKTASSGMPERLAFVALIGFGLRLSSEDNEASRIQEYLILDLILKGRFELAPPQATGVVVSTECSVTEATLIRRRGWWVRLGPGHWPGIAESNSLQKVRGTLATLFMSSGTASAPTNSGAAPIVKAAATPEMPSPIEVAPRDQNGDVPVLSRLSPILLGTNAKGSPVFYDPQSETSPLDNYNMMITGSSGKGKTQLIKAIVCNMRAQGRDVLLLDFKNDFASDRRFQERANLSCRYITFDGLPYNPLIPVPVKHPGTGKLLLQAAQHVSGIAFVLAKTFGLGNQQEAILKNVIRECFTDRGIDPGRSIEFSDSIDYPDFNDVGAKLKQANLLAYNRMDPLFDLGVFPSEYRLAGFDSILAGASVLDLSQIQSDAIKNAIAKILILSAHTYYNAREHSSVLRQFFVFDEAHRVLDSEYLVKFVRECRAYGIGVLLSSQYPTDFPQEVSASLNTKLIHGNGQEKERVRDIQKMLGITADDQLIGGMGLFHAFISNAHYNSIAMRTLAYPQYLVLEAVRSQAFDANKNLVVHGLDEQRLSITYLLELLREMELVEDHNGTFRPRGSH